MKTICNILMSAVVSLLGSCSSGNDDKKTIDPPIVSPSEFTGENVRNFMVDANSTAETAALFYNLKLMSGTKIAIGQQDAFNAFYNNAAGTSDIKKSTAHDPALLGSDFMFITDKNNNNLPSNWFYQQEQIIINDIREAWTKGMINIMCWHLREPFNEDTFYTAQMSESEKATAFKSILPGGSNHDWYKQKLDKVASVLNGLKDSDGTAIPVIFRPFHEFDGNWFWWGAAYCSPDEYKAAFRFTVDYLKNTRNVHNVLYAFSPDNTYSTKNTYLSRYPGDDYVDILGMDNYGDLNNQGQAGVTRANQKLQILSELAKEKVKIGALTETGYQVSANTSAIPGWFSKHLYSAITENNVNIAFVMFWTNSQDAYYVPVPGNANSADFIEFSMKPKITLVNSLPSMYVFP